MTSVLSVRIKPAKLARVKARAVELGYADNSKYVLALINDDMARPERKHVFASADMIGAFNTGTGPATNANTRRLITEKLRAKHEKNR